MVAPTREATRNKSFLKDSKTAVKNTCNTTTTDIIIDKHCDPT